MKRIYSILLLFISIIGAGEASAKSGELFIYATPPPTKQGQKPPSD